MKRVRRWVAKNTAIGPREWEGLNNMDWADHVSAFKAQWFIRYLDPNQSAWKEVVDEFILKDKKGKITYPEGRDINTTKLSVREKARILANFPKGYEYTHPFHSKRNHRSGALGAELAAERLMGRWPVVSLAGC